MVESSSPFAWLLNCLVVFATVALGSKFYRLYSLSKNFKHYCMQTGTVKTEHRSIVNAVLIAVQKTGYLNSDSYLFQYVARHMTREFSKADVEFSHSGEDPKESIRRFCRKHGIEADVDAAAWEWSKRPQDYRSINDFFMRRPARFAIADRGDPGVIVSPATSVVQRFASLDRMDCTVKGARYTLENCGVPEPDRFKDAACLYFYLSPADYHCFHR